MTAETGHGEGNDNSNQQWHRQRQQQPAMALGNSRFLHCDAHDKTVRIFGRNDGIGWWTVLLVEDVGG
jgi:hypothetical protein